MNNKIISRISKIREKNNKLWMEILQLAFRYAPAKSASVMQKIIINDKNISELTSELVNAVKSEK